MSSLRPSEPPRGASGQSLRGGSPGVEQATARRRPWPVGRWCWRWGQVQRAGFALHAAVQHQVGMLGQGGLQTAGQRDQGRAQALEHGQDGGEFTAFAAVEMASTTSAPVTMPRSPWLASAGAQRMRGAGGRQGGGDLAAHMAALCPCPSPPGGRWWPAPSARPGQSACPPGPPGRERSGFDFKGLARPGARLAPCQRRGVEG